MGKVFEDYFSELQADMVSICLEYVDNNADRIFIYGSCEAGMVSGDCFFEIGGKILEKHRLNQELNKDIYDTAPDRQGGMLRIICEDILKIRDVCKEYGREMPTEMKITYDVKKNSLNADYSYDLKFSNDPVKTSDDVAMEWFNEIKQKYE